MQHNKNRPRQRRFLGNNRIVKLGDSFVYCISFYYFCIDIKNHIQTRKEDQTFDCKSIQIEPEDLPYLSDVLVQIKQSEF